MSDDGELGVFRLDRALYSPMHYPGDYGFSPGMMVDQKESDQKIIAVPKRDPRDSEVHTMDQIFPHVRRELTFRHVGRDFRLTDVGGEVVRKMLV